MKSITKIVAAAALGAGLLFAPASYAGESVATAKKGEPMHHHGEREACSCPMHGAKAERSATTRDDQDTKQYRGTPVMTGEPLPTDGQG